MVNKGRKLKRFSVVVNGKVKGQELAYTKTNALKKVQSTWGKKAKVRKIKY